MIDSGKKQQLLEYLESQKYRDIHLQSFKSAATGTRCSLLFRFPRAYVVKSQRRYTAGDVSGLIYDEFITESFDEACEKYNELEKDGKPSYSVSCHTQE